MISATPPPTDEGLWRPGDPVGRRQFADLGAVALECGGELPSVTLAYETWGTLAADGSNAILVEHALTGDAHVVGEPGPGHPTPGWWDGLIGPGAPLDTDHWFVVAANVLGGCQGSTGPSSLAPDGTAWGSRFPFLTIRDQVAAEAALADQLGIGRWASVLGGSMGGMRVIEWAVTHPSRVETAFVIASTAYATADQIAWSHPQLRAIEADPAFAGGDYYDTDVRPDAGLGVARSLAHTTYRAAQELDDRFGRQAQPGEQPIGGEGRYAIESYLDHHAGKLVGRFDANSYRVLTRSMNSHDVGRGRNGVAAALSGVTAKVVAVAVDSDRLYPPRLSEEIVAHTPNSVLETVHSPYGHDGFLIETAAVGQIVARHLPPATSVASVKAASSVGQTRIGPGAA